MRIEEFKYQAKEVWYRLFHSSSRATRIYSRFVALLILLSLVTVVGPILAEELTGGIQNSNEPISQTSSPVDSNTVILIQDSSTVSATPSPTPVSNDSTPAPNSSISTPESTDSPTANVVIPAAPIENQPRFIFRFPSSVAVDPRSKSTYFPQLYAAPVSSAEYVLACLHGNGISIDLSGKGQVNILENEVEIEGDRTSSVLLTGNPISVMNVINSSGGLRAFSGNTGIAGKSIFFQFVALNKPSNDPSFCSSARSIRSIEIRALGLAQSTVKGGGKLK